MQNNGTESLDLIQPRARAAQYRDVAGYSAGSRYKNAPPPQQRRPSGRKSLVGRFFRTFFVAACVFVFCSGAVIFGFGLLDETDPIRIAIKSAIDSNLKETGSLLDTFSPIPAHTNFVILGMDDSGTRTDVMVVGTFNSQTKGISLVSIPRDTYVVMPPERRDLLWEECELWTPADGGMKLTEVHHYAGQDYGVEFAVKQIEELLDIQIPYYAKVDLSAFQYIVDEIGGVDFDVPEYMDYDDPYQDLHIHLAPGLQTLSGEDAMGLVRYRSYQNQKGDWQRVQTQQAFIKAVVDQVLSKDRLLENAGAVLETVYQYVDTNLQITDALKYLPAMADIDIDTIQTYTVPGEDGRVGGKSVVVNDPVGTAEIVDEVFYHFGGEEQAAAETSEEKSIQVLNGTYTSGLAAQNQSYLEESGFTVQNIADYNGTKADYTRVYVRKTGFGKDIQALYPGSKLIVDQTMAKQYDIVVVLGTNEG